MYSPRCFLSVLIFLLCSSSLYAQEPQPGLPPGYAYTPPPRPFLPFYSPALSLQLNAGAFDRNNNAQLRNEGGGSAFGLELGIMPERIISYRVDFMSASTSYDTTVSSSPLGTLDKRMDLTTEAIIFGVRLSYPPEGFLRFHATGGIGYFSNEMTATASRLGIPGEVNDNVSSLGFDAGAGMELNLGNWLFGFDYRRWFTGSANFPTFGVTNADTGGNYIGFGIGWLFF
jgi:hypothetical protein